jgi:hypothetical protein
MSIRRIITGCIAGAGILGLSACSGGLSSGNIFGGNRSSASNGAQRTQPAQQEKGERRETIWDLFTNVDNPNTTVEVNKYIWNAALDVLSFMPVEAADPFSGVIVFGYGTPPGDGRSYKATVYVRDPSLDARALHVSLMTRGGAASAEAVFAIEDAILTRARQLRIADSNL